MGIIYKKKEGSPGVLNAEEAERGTVLKLIKEDNPDGELSVFRNLRRATRSLEKKRKNYFGYIPNSYSFSIYTRNF